MDLPQGSYGDLIEHAPQAVAVYSLEGQLLFLNKVGRENAGTGEQDDPRSGPENRWLGADPKVAASRFDDFFRHLRDAETGTTIASPPPEPGLEPTVRGVRLPDCIALYAADATAIASAWDAVDEAWTAAEKIRGEYTALVDRYPFGMLAAFDPDLRFTAAGGTNWAEANPEVDLAALLDEGTPGEGAARELRRLARRALDGLTSRSRIVVAGCTLDVWTGPLPPDEHGAPRGMLVSRDLTHELALRDRVDLLERATDATNVGITLVDILAPDQPIIYASSGFARMTGYTRDEVIGRNCRFLQGEGTDPVTADSIREAIEDGRGFIGTIQNYRKDGSRFWNRLSLTPFEASEASEPHYYIGIQEDVTQLLESRLEHEHARRLAELGTLAGSVAHDFNHVLMEIVARVDLCDDVPEGNAVATELDGIGHAARRGATLVQQLLTYARRQTSPPASSEGGCLIRSLLPGAARLLPSRVRLRVEESGGPTVVAVDPFKMEQLLLNLFKNAADAMRDGGELLVRIVTTGDGKWVQLEVVDEGGGIPEEIRDRIFDAFFTTKGADGTGLGLSSVARIVDAAGGTVSVKSEAGRGSTFSVRLPTVNRTDEVQDAVTPRVHPPVNSLVGLCVLIAEDQPGLRDVLRRLLTRRGLTVTSASDGREALEILERSPSGTFDLILTDLEMPRMNGADLLRQAAAMLPVGEELPWMVLMSGDLGGDVDVPPHTAFLEKPFEINELLSMIERTVTGDEAITGT